MNRYGANWEDSRRYNDWLKRAYTDLLSAKLLMKDDRCFFSSCFHCQQCIEKALKAYILLMTNCLVDGHNLSWLCKQAIKLDNRFIEWLDESAALNSYYIATRYPTDLPFVISEQEISKAYKMASDMYDFICLNVSKKNEKVE